MSEVVDVIIHLAEEETQLPSEEPLLQSRALGHRYGRYIYIHTDTLEDCS